MNIKAVIVLLSVLIIGCSASEQSSNKSTTGIAPAPPSSYKNAAPGNSSAARKVSLEQSAQNQTTPPAAVVERKIIRNAELDLETTAPEEAQQKIARIAESTGGFVIESTQSSSDVKANSRDSVAMTIRVPADKFGAALDEIRQTASRVIVETVKGEDVTEEFVDIEARLKAKKALEEQFLEIMKRANSVEDALNVQRQIAEVRGEIEQIEGRKRFLENQASFSTIKIKLQPSIDFSANSSGFFYQLKQSFGKGFEAAQSFILVTLTLLVALLPFLVLIVLPIYLLIRYLLRKNRKRRSANEVLREEIGDE